MSDPNGAKKLEFFLNIHPLVRMVFSVAVIVAAGSMAWSQTHSRVGELEVEQKETGQQVGAMQRQIQGLSTGQAVLKEQITNEQERAKEFRRDVKGSLDRILRRLDGQQ